MIDHFVITTISTLYFVHIFSAYMADQPVISLEILNKRKNHTPQIESIVKLLQEHVAGNKVN